MPKLNPLTARCRDGTPHRIYADGSDTVGNCIDGAVQLKDGKWFDTTWHSDGKCVRTWFTIEASDVEVISGCDLIPVKHTAWVNVYRYPHRTKEDADYAASICNTDRIACLKVEFEEGEGMSKEVGV